MKTHPFAEIRVLARNERLLAVDKPTGVSVHNPEDPRNLLRSLASLAPRLFPVHRLDKETSGVQLFALTASAAEELAREFQERSVRKLYVGVTRGKLEPATAAWDIALSDRAESRKNPLGLTKDRVTAITAYRVINSNKYFSLVKFDLETGRQHQIRKHCANARHPLVGDARYGDPKYNARMAEIYGTSRMFLHHTRLEIAGMLLESPVPTEFGQLL